MPADDRGCLEGQAKPIRVKTRLNAFQYLSKELLSVAAEIGKEVAGLTSAEASNFSHDNPGWQVAYNTGLGGGGRAKSINMTLAMQQLEQPEDRDPWLDATPDKQLLKAFLEAAAESS